MTDLLLELGCRAALGIAVLVYEEYQKPGNNTNNNHRNATTRVTPQQVNEMNENRSSTRPQTSTNKNKSFFTSIGDAVSDHVIDPLSRLSKYLFSSSKSRATVCIFGLQGSGKTTLLEFISGVKQNNGIDPRDLDDSTTSASTTLGFNAETISKQVLQSTFFSKKEQEEASRKDSFLNSNFTFGGSEQKKIDEVCFFDVGGSAKIRPLWSKFLDNGNCDAIIFVVDASNRATIDHAAQEFQDKIVNFYLASTTSQEKIRSPKAILILATHSDLNDVMLTREIGQKLRIEEVAAKLKCSWFVQGCSLVRRDTLYALVSMKSFDYGRCLGVTDGINWLLKRVL